ncbi:U2 small nuclear ribonucleo protein A [Amniculicola lignicola CBS 123094]|uniref:U2 small nuclear ribonucleoprotein A' n=1 Tax=Amniculicola lignicola CBS 123094 TaxID=1392246 RepID=A0A6A5VUL4_9PLEO|nr:U2 small nuclear ribonucleo protein A [Amniculicola lignicola CBS 123094]
MRLTTELINGSLSYISAINERELSLRGHKISAIENMGAAKDHDCIDFTDNDIAVLGNFPLIPRLHTLMLALNRVTHIQPSLATAIPNLRSLTLTKNRLAELADLEPLGDFKKLETLHLVGNPVTSKENYRLWVIWLNPAIRFFDFQKVKLAERQQAEKLFGTQDEPTEYATEILAVKSKGGYMPMLTANGEGDMREKRIYTEEERKAIAARIRNATSLEEMAKLEKDFNDGRISDIIAMDTS